MQDPGRKGPKQTKKQAIRASKAKKPQFVPSAPYQLSGADITYIHCGVDGWCCCLTSSTCPAASGSPTSSPPLGQAGERRAVRPGRRRGAVARPDQGGSRAARQRLAVHERRAREGHVSPRHQGGAHTGQHAAAERPCRVVLQHPQALLHPHARPCEIPGRRGVGAAGAQGLQRQRGPLLDRAGGAARRVPQALGSNNKHGGGAR